MSWLDTTSRQLLVLDSWDATPLWLVCLCFWRKKLQKVWSREIQLLIWFLAMLAKRRQDKKNLRWTGRRHGPNTWRPKVVNTCKNSYVSVGIAIDDESIVSMDGMWHRLFAFKVHWTWFHISVLASPLWKFGYAMVSKRDWIGGLSFCFCAFFAISARPSSWSPLNASWCSAYMT